MGKLDDIIARAKILAKTAGEKTEEVVSLTKLKLQASQLRSDIDSNYLKLGEVVYELNKAGTENQELIDMCIAEIKSQIVELEKLEDQIAELKNVVKCPECMAANPVGALYCLRCGSPLKTQESEQPSCEAQPQEENEDTQA